MTCLLSDASGRLNMRHVVADDNMGLQQVPRLWTDQCHEAATCFDIYISIIQSNYIKNSVWPLISMFYKGSVLFFYLMKFPDWPWLNLKAVAACGSHNPVLVCSQNPCLQS